MPEEIEEIDNGNEARLEGGDEIFAGIDEVLGQPAQEVTKEPEQQVQEEHVETQETETPEQKAERERNEKGQFVEKAEKEEKVEKTEETTKEYPPEIKGVKARHHFDELTKVKEQERRRADAATIKVKDLERKVQELESRSGTAAPEVKVLQKQVQELQSKLDEREKIISFKAVEETDAFRDGVSLPTSEAEQTMEEISAQYGLDISKINQILREPNKYKRIDMISDLTESLPERATALVNSDLRDAINKWLDADKKRAQLYESAKGNREFAEQERLQTEAKAALERQQAYQSANKEVDSILKEKFPEIAGDEEKWKAIMEKAGKVADFDRLPPKAKAFANVSSWMVMPLMDMLRNERAEHQKTKEIMAKRNGSAPSAASGRASTAKPNEGEDEKDIFGVLEDAFQQA